MLYKRTACIPVNPVVVTFTDNVFEPDWSIAKADGVTSVDEPAYLKLDVEPESVKDGAVLIVVFKAYGTNAIVELYALPVD